jgi:hypothetical protein
MPRSTAVAAIAMALVSALSTTAATANASPAVPPTDKCGGALEDYTSTLALLTDVPFTGSVDGTTYTVTVTPKLANTTSVRVDITNTSGGSTLTKIGNLSVTVDASGRGKFEFWAPDIAPNGVDSQYVTSTNVECTTAGNPTRVNAMYGLIHIPGAEATATPSFKISRP